MTVPNGNVRPEVLSKIVHLSSTYYRDPYPALVAAQCFGAGKYVLITGSSTALSWARAGEAGIAIRCLHFDNFFPFVAAITAIKPSIKILAMTCDTTKSAEVAILFIAAIKKIGRIDVVVANVGTAHVGRIGEGDDDGWWTDMAANLRSTHLVAHHHAHTLGPCTTGAFISVTSGADTVVVPGISSYGITKQAVRHLVSSLSMEYPGLKVFELDPGIVRTRTMFDLGKGFAYNNPELTGMMSVWLGSGRADHLRGRYVHVTWDIEEMERCFYEVVGTEFSQG